MSPIVRGDLERYAEQHCSALSTLYDELREETYRSMPSPHMQVGKLEGSLLRMLVRLAGARRVLEIGTFTGYSALLMAEALPEGGELITCEVDPRPAAMARRFFARSPHGAKIELRMGPALETLRTLAGPFEVAFLDADKANYPRYLEALLPLLGPEGLLIADNTLWSGRVLDPKSEDDDAIARFNALLAADPRVETVLLTVRDGVTLARKRAPGPPGAGES